MKTIKVTQVRKGHKLVAWAGNPMALERARLVDGWWAVRTDRGDLRVKHHSDVQVGYHHVAVG
jgi:hypothetical protein